MDNAPWFDHPDQFDQKRIRLADIDGSGTTDIIYLHRDGVRLYFNQSGNSWSEPQHAERVPARRRPGEHRAHRPARQRHRLPGLVVAAAGRCAAADALRRPDGRAEAAPAGQDRQQPRRRNPRRSTRPRPSSTCRTSATASPGSPGCPFPVHVVERVEPSTDSRRADRFVTTLQLPPRLLRRRRARVPRLRPGRAGGRRGLRRLRRRAMPPAPTSPTTRRSTSRRSRPSPGITPARCSTASASSRSSRTNTSRTGSRTCSRTHRCPGRLSGERRCRSRTWTRTDLSAEEWREALRACKGMMLRQEVLRAGCRCAGATANTRPVKLFSTAYHNCHIRRLQPQGANRHAVFLVTESEAITYHYELDLRAAQFEARSRASPTP